MANAKSTSGKISVKENENTKGKIVINMSVEKSIKLILCFFLHYATVFSSMHPLGIGFFGALFSKKSWIVFYVSSILGCIFSGNGIIYPIVLTAMTCVFALWDGFEDMPKYRAIATSLVFFLFSAVKCSIEGIIIYSFLASALESLIAGTIVYIFSRGGNVLLNIRKRNFVSESEVMYAYTVMALLIFSLNPIEDIWGLRVSSVVAMVIIFSMCYSKGETGAIYLAILLGVVGSTQSPEQSAIMSTYAFGTILSYRLKRYGKIGIIFGFVISNTIFSLFLTETYAIVLNLYDSFIAAIIFLLLPGKVMDYFRLLSQKGEMKIHETSFASPDFDAARKIRHMSDSFRGLADIYKKISDKGEKRSGSVIYPIKEIKDKVCTACPRKEKCFSKDGAAIKTLEKVSSPWNLNPASLPQPLPSVCHRCDSFTQIIKEHYAKSKSDKMWTGKINECRNLIARQLFGISESLKKNADEICVKRDEKAEENLWSVFDDAGSCPCMIYAEEKLDGEYDIEIYFHEKDVDRETKTKSLSLVEKALGQKVEFAGTRKEKDKIVFVFCPKRGYSASFGYATMPKRGEKVCGDSFNVIYTKRDKMVMILSDGMGSGEEAARQSRETVALMENFLKCGFETELCAQLINSSLILKGEKESFATLDLCVIDLSLSSISFTKLGAATSYIKLENKIFPVKARSLPAGILTETEAEKHMLSFESDTIILLMSDGVADISLKNPNAEGWIKEELEKITPGTNPQIIARRILDRAASFTGGTSDDMTVIAASILKV